MEKLLSLWVLALLLFSCQPSTEKPPAEPIVEDESIEEDRLFYHAFPGDSLSEAPDLVLVLHGDAPFRPPSYQYGMAKRIAEQYPQAVAVGILRPGYEDAEGNRSPGEKGQATGDNYTREVINAIHQLSQELKQTHEAGRVVLVGHSGGAALAANLLSLYPDDFAGGLLLSCPCDVPRWREHMTEFQGNESLWSEPVESLSPQALATQMGTETQLYILHGAADEVVPPVIATDYAAALKANGTPTELMIIDELGHDLFFAEVVFVALGELLGD